MRAPLLLSLLLFLGCSAPTAQSSEAAAPAQGGGKPAYVTGVLPIDAATMVYQRNNVGTPATALFRPTGANRLAAFNPGYGLLNDDHELIIDFPAQWEVKNLSIKLLDGEGEFNPGQRYYAVARGSREEKLVYTFTGNQYDKEITVALPRDVVYDRLILRGPKQAQPARLELVGDYRPFTPKLPARTRAPLAALTGANAFPWNFNKPDGSGLSDDKYQALGATYGGVLRVYVELEKFVPAAGQYQFRYWNLDEMARRTHADGHDLLLTFVHATRPEQETWPKHSYEGKEFADPDAPPYPHAADPMQETAYRGTGEAGYQLAARYGHNAAIAEANLRCTTVPEYPGAPLAAPRKGLGYVRYYETGNELDKDWKGKDHYMSGWQLGLYQSAVYDGAQGRLGPLCGIKTADPTAIVLSPGLAKATPDAWRGMVDCWKKTRGYKKDGTLDIPVDQWNYHQYSNDAGSVQNNGQQTRGVSPELGGLGATARRMVEFAAQYGGNRPVVITETGYDVQPRSPLAAVRAADLRLHPQREQIPAARIQLTQGIWSLRTLLEVAAAGIDGIAWYQAYDDNGAVPYVYQSSGQLNGDNTRRPAGDFLRQARALLGTYTFRERLSENPRVDVWQHGAERLAVLWLPVEDDEHRTYPLRLPTAGRYYTPTVGAAAMASKPLPTANGAAQVPLSEMPVFVPLK